MGGNPGLPKIFFWSCLNTGEKTGFGKREGRESGFKTCPKISWYTVPGPSLYPQIIHSYIGFFHYKPSFLGYHYSWKHPYGCFRKSWALFWSTGLVTWSILPFSGNDSAGYQTTVRVAMIRQPDRIKIHQDARHQAISCNIVAYCSIWVFPKIGKHPKMDGL